MGVVGVATYGSLCDGDMWGESGRVGWRGSASGGWTDVGVLGGGWTRESGGGRVRRGWIDGTCCGDAWLASPKNWVAGPSERRGRWIQFAQCYPRLWHTNHEQAVSVWCTGIQLTPPSTPDQILDSVMTLSSVKVCHCRFVERYRTENSLGSKRHSLQAVQLSQRTQTAVQIVSNLPASSNGGQIYRFLGMSAMRTRWMVGAVAHKSG